MEQMAPLAPLSGALRIPPSGNPKPHVRWSDVVSLRLRTPSPLPSPEPPSSSTSHKYSWPSISPRTTSPTSIKTTLPPLLLNPPLNDDSGWTIVSYKRTKTSKPLHSSPKASPPAPLRHPWRGPPRLWNKTSYLRCFRCGNHGHMADACRNHVRCTKCNTLGHYSYACPFSHRPSSSSFNRRSAPQNPSSPTRHSSHRSSSHQLSPTHGAAHQQPRSSIHHRRHSPSPSHRRHSPTPSAHHHRCSPPPILPPSLTFPPICSSPSSLTLPIPPPSLPPPLHISVAGLHPLLFIVPGGGPDAHGHHLHLLTRSCCLIPSCHCFPLHHPLLYLSLIKTSLTSIIPTETEQLYPS